MRHGTLVGSAPRRWFLQTSGGWLGLSQSPTFAFGARITAEPSPTAPFTDRGGAAAGPVSGLTPVLTGTGQLVTGGPVSLDISNVQPGSFAVYMISSFSAGGFPLANGGMLWAQPELVLVYPVPGSTVSLPFNWPGASPGSRFWFQAVVIEDAVTFDFGMTNGLCVTQP